MCKLGIAYLPMEWRLFIDSSISSLKVVLLHIGNEKSSISIAYGSYMKEIYENLNNLMGKIQYESHSWKICADLKVISMLLGMPSGYIKYCCFLCYLENRARSQHYMQKDWPKKSFYVSSTKNVCQTPIVDSSKIILPPLHIKLGLLKNFVKAMNKSGEGFKHLQNLFPTISSAKLNEYIFIGPDIRKVIKDSYLLVN